MPDSLYITLGLTFIIGLLFKTKFIQYLRPVILLASLIYFGFITAGCNCVLFYFQGFILFLLGKSAFLSSFVFIVAILVLSFFWGAIWCGWLCWLGGLQEFIFRQNKWNLFQSKKTQKILLYVQIGAFAALVIWVITTQRPVLCTYDPFISIFRLKIFNWIGYITVPLLLLSSLFIYRPFCRICPIGLMLYVIKYIPFAKQLKLKDCQSCRKCNSHCKMKAIPDFGFRASDSKFRPSTEIEKTCMMCGECKMAKCKSIKF
jgi:polyferredoxin